MQQVKEIICSIVLVSGILSMCGIIYLIPGIIKDIIWLKQIDRKASEYDDFDDDEQI